MKTPDNSEVISPIKPSAQVVKLPVAKPVIGSPGQAISHYLATHARRVKPQAKAREEDTRQRQSLWYALYFPQLATLGVTQQDRMLNELAAQAQTVSSTVSFHPLALVCEIRSSLKYFAGIDSLHERLQPQIREALQQHELPGHFLYAACPTVSGSLLLARSGHNALVYQKDKLRTVLGQLPTEVLELNREQNRRLYNMGIRQIRDIWRLPTDGLRKRFGSEFINLLNKALGTAPEPTRNYTPPPAFTSDYELPYELENLDRLLPVVDEMLAQLCDFLRRRDLSTSRLLLSLQHEKRDSSDITLGLRQASRCREHLLQLLETHFSQLTIPAPVTGVRLEVMQFDAFMTEGNSLLAEDRAGTNDHNIPRGTVLNQFMEQLHARLGEGHLKSIRAVAEHCPEYACQEDNYDEAGKRSRDAKAVAPSPRPLWLLPEPQQLVLRNGKLYHRKAIVIISGPERIESRWWLKDIRRDYYVAQEQNGSRLWIYRERDGGNNWYLHGFFA